MNTDHIKSIFFEYLKTDNPQYAILLNGDWGSGKTYFWKNELHKIAKENNFKSIYISLNGVSKVENLERLLFLKLVPFFKNQENRLVKGATTLVRNIGGLLGKKIFDIAFEDIYKNLSVDIFDFSKYVICFDDLERCQIPIKETLGFINNFVEHKGLKTIILSYEKEIDPTESGYRNIKEKLIGRTLNLELSLADIFPLLFEKYIENQDFFGFLLQNQHVFVNIFKKYHQNNLRTISYYLNVLEKLYPHFKNVDDKYIQEIILFAAIITIEFKKGNLTSSDGEKLKELDEINQHFYSRNIRAKLKESNDNEDPKTKKKSYAEVFNETYLTKSFDNYHTYPSVYRYIVFGYLHLEDLIIELKERYPKSLPKEIQDYLALVTYDFRKLSDEQFKKLKNDVLKYAQEGKYSLYDYAPIASFFYFFSDNKIISESIEDINNILTKGLAIAKTRKSIDKSSLENLLHFEDHNPEVTKIKQQIKLIHQEIKQEEYVSDGNELVDSIITEDQKKLISLFEKHTASRRLFEFIEKDSCFKAFSKTSNAIISIFTRLLNNRYETSNIGEYLYDDIEFLSELRSYINERLIPDNNQQKLRLFLLHELTNTLESTCTHLENTRKK